MKNSHINYKYALNNNSNSWDLLQLHLALTPCKKLILKLDLGARTISPLKCLTKYERENKETKINGIIHVKGANIKPLYYIKP